MTPSGASWWISARQPGFLAAGIKLRTVRAKADLGTDRSVGTVYHRLVSTQANDDRDQDSAVRTEPDGRPADLSERQYACLARAGEGMSSKEIGRLLGISPSTVDNHIHAAVTKLHARNRWHAAQLLHPERTKAGQVDSSDAALLPPIGGRPNTARVPRRLMQILTIAVMALIVLTAATTIVLGALAVFRPN